MPKQKDLKRIVRSRMRKTGESYTAARLRVLKKKEPAPQYAALAGWSEAAVKKQTGRTWSEWVKTLDAARMTQKPHREIAEYVYSLGTPGWWSQTVTVGYERIRGLRERGQRRGGSYETNKSRTFPVPVAKLYSAFANARTRARWLPEIEIKVRTATPNKTMRLSWENDQLVQFYFVDKGPRSAVAVQHQKLPDKASADKLKTWWGQRFDALSKILDKSR